MESDNNALMRANYQAWEDRHATQGWGKYPNEHVIRAVMWFLGKQQNKSRFRILEIGCGSGANLWFIGSEGFRIAGLDISETAIVNAYKLIAQYGIRPEDVDLRVGDFQDMPWNDTTFDMVVDVEALVHMPLAGIRAAVKEVSRVLRPGGLLFSVMFGGGTTGAGSGKMLEPGTTMNPTIGPIADIGVVHFATLEELTSLFSPLEIVNVDSCDRTTRNGRDHIFEWLITARR